MDRRGVKNKTIRTAVDEQVAFQRIDFFFFRVKKMLFPLLTEPLKERARVCMKSCKVTFWLARRHI